MGQAITHQQQSFIGPLAGSKTYSRHSRRGNKAKRLAETKQMSREQWLHIRKQGIGSSDAATACGLNPHMSMLELWMIKTGRMQQNIEDESTGYAPLYWGKQLEPLVAEYYSMHTNNKVRRVNAVLQHPDEDKAFMLANLDYAIVGSDEVQVLECKTVGEYGSKLWRDGVPLYVLCQVQHQLAVTGKQAAHVCVLFCGHETRIYKVTRSESVIEHIIHAERHFWQCVENDIPPAVDASESAAKALQALYPEQTPLLTEDLTNNNVANTLFRELLAEKRKIETHQQLFDELKHRIQILMKDAERVVFMEGSVTWKKAQDSIGLNSKALLKQHPEYLEQFPQTKAGTRRFQIYPNGR
ncbi:MULTISPECIES: YqaJ viral recombinase family protein [Acinetobacter]|uniref:YqaJ-like viral recombinase domain protein n=2 Tax=Acinetobacter baumannii TaxID=470 RepID=A0AAJ0QVU1_ACIBA|nr:MULTISPECIES: YqaJ viral recombinase family protein [Acinetobacter]EHF3479142.1 YqaJ-like viral recombinase [Acinetobacter baumannii]EHU1300133.1 YqaJ viral recombinase family protein [Acinetobacter baumannii]EHU2820109.1 YqaJ viral recombinase family protein [Acinetobacter baumannii]EHU2824640.1 YqaJ viral recombinase family protein [Acinetobacter baumannii]EHU2833182.1 YqaJ viral recombinase family protein [Acinetobacter baumannii]